LAVKKILTGRFGIPAGGFAFPAGGFAFPVGRFGTRAWQLSISSGPITGQKLVRISIWSTIGTTTIANVIIQHFEILMVMEHEKVRAYPGPT
jgi:hypothetical protein